jgi:uroporphyrin-III C-methyltransferase
MSKHRGYTLLLFLLLLLTGSTALSYYLWGQLQQLREQTRNLPQINEQLTELQAKFKQSPQQQTQVFNEKFQPLQQELQLMAKQRQQTDANVAVLSHQVSQLIENPDWVMAEVNYLVTLAHYRLSIAKDVTGALLALTAADDRLRRLNNPALDKIRVQLSKDMLSLRNLPQIDVEAIITRLAEYVAQTDNFTLIQGKLSAPATTATPTPAATTDKNLDWQQQLAHIGAALKNLVIIRYNENAETGKLSVDQRFYITENLRLKLEMARLAAYRRDSQSFTVAIHAVEEWLNRYFDQHDKAIQALLKDLEKMQDTVLTQQLPDISESLRALQRVAIILSETPNIPKE